MNIIILCLFILTSSLSSHVPPPPPAHMSLKPHRMDHSNYFYFVIATSLQSHTRDPITAVTSLVAPFGLHCVSQFRALPNYYIVRALKLQHFTAHLLPDFDQWEHISQHGRKPVHHPNNHHARSLHRSLDAHPLITFVEPQIPRTYLFKRHSSDVAAASPNSISSTPSPPFPTPGSYTPESPTAVLQRYRIKDPGFPNQWHLWNLDIPTHDVNVIPAWSMNVTGHNITVAILDDGLDYKSVDLRDQFEPKGSYDFNDHQDLPTPKLNDDYHGTRCAGEVAASINDVCGVGVAFNARVSGIRILSGTLVNADEAQAFMYANQINDIYSCSFGPSDNGKVVEGPSELVLRSFFEGWHNGRRGLGSVYVFASGNGGPHQDNCNADGYTNLNLTITIGATNRDHNSPWYEESCSAQFAVTYSGSNGPNSGIYTTDVGERQCTSQHSGTSAAAPLGAGILALVLSARPDLSVRTLQYLIVNNAVHFESPSVDKYSKYTDLPNGLKFSHKFGYGKLDAARLVSAALAVKQNVYPHVFLESPWSQVNKPIHSDNPPPPLRPAPGIGSVNSTIEITQAMVDQLGGNATRTETVLAIVHIDHDQRGDLEIDLISPHGVVSFLMTKRPYDIETKGFQNWTFSTVQHWGENIVGVWTLRVSDWVGNTTKGKFQGWALQAALESRTPGSNKPSLPNPIEPRPIETLKPPVTNPIKKEEGSFSTSTAVGLLVCLLAFGFIAGGLLKAFRAGKLSREGVQTWISTHVPGMRRHDHAQYEFQTLQDMTDDREVMFDEFLTDDVDIDFDSSQSET